MPALALDEAGRYVAAAYLAFGTIVVVYVVIIVAKLTRMGRRLETVERRGEHGRR